MMDKDFTLSLEQDCTRLVFTHGSTRSKSRMHITLSADVSSRLRENKSMCDFQQTYAKSCFTPVIKGAKLNEYLTLGLSCEHPLFISFGLDIDMSTEVTSRIDVYICSKVAEAEYAM